MTAPVVPRPPGWYPDPEDDVLFRWWDGAAWNNERRGWFLFGRWFDPTTRNGRRTVWAVRHPVAYWLGIFVALTVGEAVWGAFGDHFNRMVAPSIATVCAGMAWMARTRAVRRHRAFWRTTGWSDRHPRLRAAEVGLVIGLLCGLFLITGSVAARAAYVFITAALWFIGQGVATRIRAKNPA